MCTRIEKTKIKKCSDWTCPYNVRTGSSSEVGLEYTEILPNLFLGNCVDAYRFPFKEKDLVVHLIPALEPLVPGVDYIDLKTEDSVRGDDTFISKIKSTNALERVKEQLDSNSRVLVHCQIGRFRAPTFVLLYLLTFHRDTFPTISSGMKFIHARRDIAFFPVSYNVGISISEQLDLRHVAVILYFCKDLEY